MFSRSNKNKGKKSDVEVSIWDEQVKQDVVETPSEPTKPENIYDHEKVEPGYQELNESVVFEEITSLESVELSEQTNSYSKENNLFVEENLEHIELPSSKIEEDEVNSDDTTKEIETEGLIVQSSELIEKVEGLNILIGEQFSNLERKLDYLSSDFEVKLKFDQHKEQTIDKLHKELQGYKDNLIHERLIPIIMDLIFTIDRTTKLKRTLVKESEHNKHLEVIDGTIVELEDILYKQGVESYECEGNQFDSSRQKIVRTIKTDDGSLDKQIADRIGKGFEWGEKVIRKEQVTVYLLEG